MKIVSCNVNGIMACKRKGFQKVVVNSQADVFCCQEVRAWCSLNLPEYHQYWCLGERPGYSGTLILAKEEPLSIEYGMGVKKFDDEGRLIRIEYEKYYIINVYVPNSQSGQERQDYRAEWDAVLFDWLQTLEKPVILCGDFNVARDYIDIYPENLRNDPNPPGFLSQEREGLEHLLESGLCDVFRELYPDKGGSYTWWSNRLNKRLENRGWRLDYFLISGELIPLVRDCRHHTDILGSDHCPISLTLKASVKRATLSEEELAAMWQGLDWEQLEDELLEQQKSLARVAYAKHWSHVGKLQRKLVKSLPARALAVRHVIQIDAQSGIDGVKWRTDSERMRAALSLSSKGYRATPYRGIVLKEENGKARKINVPVAYDKAMQTLYAYALDPVAESMADRKSFAFRRGRSMMDVHAYICSMFDVPEPPYWVVKADVRACYDSISHDWLLENVRMDKRILKEFLRAGVAFGGDLFPTETGISQGASLSSILGNIALDGLQDYLYEHLYPDGEIDYQFGNMVRYADDILVTARTELQGLYIIALISEFIAVRGLKLNEDKTLITNMATGFEFLSRKYQIKDGILVAKPSDNAIQKFKNKLKKTIMSFSGSQRSLINKLNQMLNGWANYHRITDIDEAFRSVDNAVQALLAKKMRSLYPGRRWEDIRDIFWIVDYQGRHIFALKDNAAIQVVRLASILPATHKPVRTGFHPYLDGEYYAWLQEKRDRQKVSGAKRRGIWEREAGLCYYCGKPMLRDQKIELIEINLGQGARASNMAYVHKCCNYNVLYDQQLDMEEFSFFDELEGITEPTKGLEDPYGDLKEFFRVKESASVTLTFKEIESIIGFDLGWEARCKAFWFDEAPVGTGELWAKEFPFHAIEPSTLIAEHVISDAWRTQGYSIKRLDIAKEKVVFRRTVHKVSGLVIPKPLMDKKLPDNAVHELNTYFAYIIKKYGL